MHEPPVITSMDKAIGGSMTRTHKSPDTKLAAMKYHQPPELSKMQHARIPVDERPRSEGSPCRQTHYAVLRQQT